MNDSELDRILKAAKEPARPAGYWEQFAHDVRIQLPRGQVTARVPANRSFRLTLGLAAAAACLIVGFLISHRQGRFETASNELFQNQKAVREMLALFPRQVRAIVQDERGLNFVLSEQEDVPESAPLYVQVCDGKNCSSWITFSGQELQIAGQKITVLSDAKGGVILMGDQFLWSKEEPQRLAGALRIEARELASTGAS